MKNINWWVPFGILMMALVIVLGYHKYYIGGDNRIHRRFSNRLFEFVGYIGGIVMMLLLASFSGRGVLQLLLDGQRPDEDPIYAVFGAFIIIVTASFFYGVALYYAGRVSGRYKKLKLLHYFDPRY